ncbi:MAG: hypothetical protein SR3Q1_01160 [Quinella sp. 3Q1]|nr:hypothetical protein [Quinella sp. 3Q1]MBR3051629.1 hypothetical protein [Selenomonadaceae bacterium]MBR6888805.1 hypothetical protein [Selenomonadaceae bacterium]
MTKEILKDEILMDAELEQVAGGAGVASWFKAIGGTLLGIGAAVASVANPALVGVAIVSLASGAKGITEVATE